MDDLFNITLYILVKLDVLSLLDSTEHFVFFFQLAKTFRKNKRFQHQIPAIRNVPKLECHILVWKALFLN